MKIVYLAPEGFDYSSNQITEGLHLLQREGEIEFICTNAVIHHGAKLVDLKLHSTSEARSHLDSADIILISSGGDYSFTKGLRGLVMANKELRKKLVFLDGHDSNNYLIDPDNCALYLKRELRYPEANNLAWKNVRGFTFGVYDFHFDKEQPLFDERKIDICFVAYGGSSPLRAECVERLQRMNLKTDLDILAEAPGDKQPYSIESYRNIMRNSKVIISIPGAGIDTLRFWEAMGFGGVLVSPDISKALYVRDYPEPHRQAVYFDSWEAMQEQIVEIVSNKSWWNSIRLSADNLIRCKHSTKERAKQLINLFKEVGGLVNHS